MQFHKYLDPMSCVLGVVSCAGAPWVASRVVVQTLIERQNSLAEMAAMRQAQEKRRQRQMAIEAARKVGDKDGGGG